jgi:peptidoglycan/LPS O-acetylase OafA/YrhL
VSSDGETAVLDRPTGQDQAPAGRTAPGLGYRPALDGLRGLSVLAIMAYHAQVPGGRGAFLGVSTFFTLSGFLITTITLAEHQRRGRVRITGFYARRARRLMPAGVVAILLIAATTLLVGTASQVIRLRGDALGSLFYIANWRLILTGDSYGNLFQSPSMYLHFWSLAIEEQFYLAFPLAVALCLWAARGSRKLLAAVIGLATLASIAWSAHLFDGGAGVDRAYFGTDTRLPELAIGCLAALWWWRRDRGPAVAGSRSGGRGRGPVDPSGNGGGATPPARPGVAVRLLPWAGLAALAAIVVLWHTVERTSGTLYHGGLAAYAVLSVTVVLAAIQSRGPVPHLLGWRPLVWIGTVSYAAYLIHWPVMVVLRQQTALPWEGIAVVAIGLTLVLSALSQRALERPIRSGRWPRPRVAPTVAAGAIGLAAVTVVAATQLRRVSPDTVTLATTDLQAQADKLAALGSTNPQADLKRNLEALAHATPQELAALEHSGKVEKRVAASTAPRVAFFGDSSASMTGVGFTDWSLDHLDELAPAPGQTDLGCGLLVQRRRRVDGETVTPPSYCKDTLERWVGKVTNFHTDVAVIQLGPWDVREQQLRKGGRYLTLGEDPELARAMERRLDEIVTTLLAHVQVVELISPPDLEIGREDGRSPRRQRPESDPDRMAAFRAIIDTVGARHADRVAVVPLAEYLAGRDDDNELRPDGVHFTEETSHEVSTAFLGPEILRLYALKGGTPQTTTTATTRTTATIPTTATTAP